MKTKDEPRFEKSLSKPNSVWIDSNPTASRLSDFDARVLSIVMALGVTHTTVLRILMRANRFRINQSLRVLWMIGAVHRDIQGLVISTQATEDDAELKAFIEQSFKTHLT